MNRMPSIIIYGFPKLKRQFFNVVVGILATIPRIFS